MYFEIVSVILSIRSGTWVCFPCHLTWRKSAASVIQKCGQNLHFFSAAARNGNRRRYFVARIAGETAVERIRCGQRTLQVNWRAKISWLSRSRDRLLRKKRPPHPPLVSLRTQLPLFEITTEQPNLSCNYLCYKKHRPDIHWNIIIICWHFNA